MLIGVQWTTSEPGDWDWMDLKAGPSARVWEALAKRPKPKKETYVAPDRQKGWVMALNCQGIIFEGCDCYSVQLDITGTGLIVTGWTEDYPGENLAVQWTLYDPAPDHRLKGQINTVQSVSIWADNPGDSEIKTKPFSEFVRPPEAVIRYGVYVPEPLLNAHKAKREQRGWEAWIK